MWLGGGFVTLVEQVALGGLALNAMVIVGTQFAGYVKLRAKVDAIVVQTTSTNGTIAEIQAGGCNFRREHIQREIAEEAARLVAANADRAHADADRAHTDAKP